MYGIRAADRAAMQDSAAAIGICDSAGKVETGGHAPHIAAGFAVAPAIAPRRQQEHT
jgi:hypothetical protein